MSANLCRMGHYIGGALELSRSLENRVKHEPRRFAELALKFPDHTNLFYFEAVLRGITDTDLDLETIVRVCERCHRIEGRPLGRDICDPIASSAQEEVPAEALDLVAWYATEDLDPPTRTVANPGFARGRALLWRGHPDCRHKHESRQGCAGDGKIDRERPQKNNVLPACIGEDGPRPFNCCQVLRSPNTVGCFAS